MKRLIEKLNRKVRSRRAQSKRSDPPADKPASSDAGQKKVAPAAPPVKRASPTDKPASSRAGQGDAAPQRKRQRRRSGKPRSQGPSGPDRDGARSADPPTSHWTPDMFQVPAKDDASRFHDFGLPDELMHAIHDLGFQYCTPIQEKVLNHVKEGQNIAGRAQTGTGKTAAFLMCAFSQFLANRADASRKNGAPRALILAPTRELVMQIVEDAKAMGKYTGFRCVAVYGGVDFDKQRRELENNQIDLVAATPGRLLDFKQRGVLDLKQVEVLVIDEADRMLDMGFIPDVRRIIRATPPKDKRRTMLFSATLTDDVLRLASQWMPDPAICEIEPDKVAVDTVKQIVYVVTAREKFRLLYNMLQRESMDRVLIFGNRRDSTMRLVDNLKRHGIDCEYLSGAVRQEKRQKVIEGFKNGKIKIVVATDVAGRGLHVDNIDHVVNYEFPYEPEDYVHRIGRTGRAGVEGTAISFACEEESFVVPEIEKYIGQKLDCVMPEEELLAAPPRPTRPAHKPSDTGRSGPQGRGGGRRPSGSGGRGGGRSSARPSRRR